MSPKDRFSAHAWQATAQRKPLPLESWISLRTTTADSECFAARRVKSD